MNGTCGAGRRRRMRGGMGYGFDGSTIGTAGAVYGNSWGGEITKAGAPVTNMDDPMRGSSRRRKTSRKTRRSRRSRRGRRGGGDEDDGSEEGDRPIDNGLELEIYRRGRESRLPAEAPEPSQDKPQDPSQDKPQDPSQDKPQQGGRRRKTKRRGRKTRRGGVDGSVAAGNSEPKPQSGFPPISMERMREPFNFGQGNVNGAQAAQAAQAARAANAGPYPSYPPLPMNGPAAVGAPTLQPGPIQRWGGRKTRRSSRSSRSRRRRGGQMEFCPDGSAPNPDTKLCADGSEPKTTAPNMIGSRRRKSSRKTRRKMRGGMSVAHSSAGFTGTGERGLANYQDVGGSQPFSNNVVPLS